MKEFEEVPRKIPDGVLKMSIAEIDVRLMREGAETDIDICGEVAWLWGRKNDIEVGFYFEKEDGKFVLKEFIE